MKPHWITEAEAALAEQGVFLEIIQALSAASIAGLAVIDGPMLALLHAELWERHNKMEEAFAVMPRSAQ